MINPSNILTVLVEDINGITDVTTEASDPSSDTFRTDVTPLNSIYVGFEKPINALYFYIASGFNVDGGKITLEYWSTSGWKGLSPVDQTKFFSRSGVMNWNMPTDAAKLELNGIEQYYLCMYSDDSALNVEFQYIGLVFSDDLDIGIEYPSVLKECFYPAGKTDFFLYHVSAKNYIMSELLRRNYTRTVNGVKEPITQWDILDIYELKQASLYYAMSQIFFNLSDNSSDNYWQKYLEYKSRFDQAFNLGILRIDQDNDGQVDSEENETMKSFRWIR